MAIRRQAACIIGGGVAVVLVEQYIGIVRAVVQIVQHHDFAAAHGACRPLPNIGQCVMVANNPIGRQGADVRHTVGHVLRLRAAEPCAVCQLRFAHRFLRRFRLMRQQHAIKSLRAHEIRQMPVVRAHDERAAVPLPLQRMRQRYAAHHMPAADVYRCVRTNQKFHSPSLMPIPNTGSCSHRPWSGRKKTAYRTIGNTRIVSDWLCGRCKKSSLHINRRHDRHRHNRDNGRNGGRGAKGGGNRRCCPCGAPKARGR